MRTQTFLNRKFMQILCLSFATTLGLTNLQGAMTGIDSIVLNGDNSLSSATVGGTAYSGGVIASTAQDDFPVNGLTGVTTGGALIIGDSTVSTPHDNDVLTGAGGGQGNPQTNGILQLFWGDGAGELGFTDNDADPDFFVFEDSGNDAVVARAILADDTYGAAVSLSGWNTVRADGVLNGTLTNRPISGVAFDFTDLLDASGVNLTNGTAIHGIWIGDQNDADFYEVYANVDILTIPEPSTAILAGLGLMGVCFRRHRK